MSFGSDQPFQNNPVYQSAPLAPIPAPLERILRHELHHLKTHWWWLLLLGVLLVVCGTTAVIFPLVSSVAVIEVLGVLLLVCGVATVVGAFWAGKWSGLLLQLLCGILYIAAGMTVNERPGISLVVLAFFISVSFIVMGAFRILAALLYHFPQWGWALLNGIVTALIGIVIQHHLPGAALWVVGMLVGMELLFNGWTWIMLSLAIRHLPEHDGAGGTPARVGM